MNVKIKVAQFRLSHSRMPFCVAYMRETLEILLDAHVRAFDFYGGVCRKGVYDNCRDQGPDGKGAGVQSAIPLSGYPLPVRVGGLHSVAGWEKGRSHIHSHLEGRFLAEHGNVILVGGTGTGKTHLSVAIGRQAIRNGRRGK